ncbi:hypothetical protein D3C78_1557010 [compost metagenome]
MKSLYRQQGVGDANEFGNTPVDAANLGQHIPHHVIYKPFHRGQYDLHTIFTRTEKAPPCGQLLTFKRGVVNLGAFALKASHSS